MAGPCKSLSTDNLRAQAVPVMMRVLRRRLVGESSAEPYAIRSACPARAFPPPLSCVAGT